MKIRCIFGQIETGNSLHAILYDGQNVDIYEQLMDNWFNPEWVRNYLTKNSDYLASGFYKGLINETACQIMDEAEEMEEILLGICDGSNKNGLKNLGMFFKPLTDSDYKVSDIRKEKTSVKSRQFPKPFLRIYALRISQDLFIVTGGAIKLTQTMQQHADTKRELERISQAKDFLTSKGITTADDLIYYYDNGQ